MRTCAESWLPTSTPKNPGTPSAPGIFQKSSFCKRTQAAWDQKNTDSFPGFLGLSTPPARVPALDPKISHPQPIHRLPEIQTHPPGQPRAKCKNAKRTEPNPGILLVWRRRHEPSALMLVHRFRRRPKNQTPWPGSPTCARCRGNLTSQSPHDPQFRQRRQSFHASAGMTRLLIDGQHRRSDEPAPSMVNRRITVAIGARGRTTSRRSASLTLINVSNQIKLKRAGQSVHTIG